MAVSVQYIFVLEADKKAKTDMYYIDSAIKYFYVLPNTVKISYLYLGGKYKYKQNKIEKEIGTLTNRFQHGSTIIIYTLDKDKHYLSHEDKAFVKEVEEVCKQLKRHCIWLVSDIESVFLGVSVSDNKKTVKATEFLKKSLINKVDVKLLSQANPVNHRTSNILVVLDQFLVRK